MSSVQLMCVGDVVKFALYMYGICYSKIVGLNDVYE